ncbi:MAG: AbrB/MazE/SpoVT family DNA-binding domain-containing protein [Gammaproteobacteria bacterium]|nr:MAG: AbrB/MazE/SpoVT family DNA-binding domain-containing protein [Gammaproteobacteria bacterium]UTW41734.1 AbrB/MazE/SpoVT family DNA-binding domain-containing protein [bacterium SCSIO 12844]
MISTVFKSGNSQAIRIPKKLNVDSTKVDIKKIGNALIIRELPEEQDWDLIFQCLDEFEDFMSEGRIDLPLQKREKFK